MTRISRTTRHRLDTRRLLNLIDQNRRERGLTWHEAVKEIGVSTSLPSNLRHGKSLTADSLLTVMAWVGLTDIRQILTTREVSGA